MSDSGRDWGASSDEEIAKQNASKRRANGGQRKAIDIAELNRLHAAGTQGEWRHQ
jgi:hypothetical protein